MKDYVFKVEGMMCEHCSARLKKVLENISGVQEVNVNLAEKKAIITAEDGLIDILKEAITDAGFDVTE